MDDPPARPYKMTVVKAGPQNHSPSKDAAEPQHTPEEVMPALPPYEHALRVGFMERKSIDTKGIAWTKRLVMLTEEICYFATIDRTVLDFIYMKDMAECDLVDDEDLKKKGMMEVVFRTVNEIAAAATFSAQGRTMPTNRKTWLILALRERRTRLMSSTCRKHTDTAALR